MCGLPVELCCIELTKSKKLPFLLIDNIYSPMKDHIKIRASIRKYVSESPPFDKLSFLKWTLNYIRSQYFAGRYKLHTHF